MDYSLKKYCSKDAFDNTEGDILWNNSNFNGHDLKSSLGEEDHEYINLFSLYCQFYVYLW